MNHMISSETETMKNYEIHFGDQLRVHKNIAAFKLFALDSDDIFGFFETTEDCLLDILVARPDLVTEANVSLRDFFNRYK